MIMTRNPLIHIKNYLLAGVALLYYIFCKVFSFDLIYQSGNSAKHSSPVLEINSYLRDNLAFVLLFLLFISVASTSFLLGYLISYKFDRNRTASKTAVRAGLFFLCAATYIVTGSDMLDVFSEHILIFDYIRNVSLIFMALMFTSYASTVNNKKWLRVVDRLFFAAGAAYFLCCFLRLLDIADLLIEVITLSMLVNLIFCSFIHTRDLLRRKSHAKVAFAIFGILELFFLSAAAVFFFLRFRYYYLLSLGLALASMAYLVFNELVNIAARRYAKTPDTESYRKMAYIDSLCGIANRNAFLLEQDNTFDSDSLYYVIFDVNNMKLINDTCGHSEGDRILRKSAEFISRSFDDIGKSFRIGGDEFAVIGQYMTAEEIEAALKNLDALISDYNEGSHAKLDLAYGYAVRENIETNTYELFNKADKSMYRAKRKVHKEHVSI